MVAEMDTCGGKSVGMKAGSDENLGRRTERSAPKAGVRGSNPLGRAIVIKEIARIFQFFASAKLTKNSPTKRAWFHAIGGGIAIQSRPCRHGRARALEIAVGIIGRECATRGRASKILPRAAWTYCAKLTRRTPLAIGFPSLIGLSKLCYGTDHDRPGSR